MLLHDGVRHGPPFRIQALGGPVTRGLGSGPAGRMNKSSTIQGWVWCDERTHRGSVGVSCGSAGGTGNGTHKVSRTTSAASRHASVVIPSWRRRSSLFVTAACCSLHRPTRTKSTTTRCTVPGNRSIGGSSWCVIMASPSRGAGHAAAHEANASDAKGERQVVVNAPNHQAACKQRVHTWQPSGLASRMIYSPVSCCCWARAVASASTINV